ncbi:MAG: hypothetical protein OEZ43_01015 [Gammaproteobacteria bacterium]|nr:hypothetical protein [Gammaproteobacteria bacterium]
MKTIKASLLMIISLFVSAGAAQAEDKYALGLQSMYISNGISGKLFLNDKTSLQAVLGSGWWSTDIAVRGLFKFKEEKKYNLYGAAGVGVQMWRFGTGTGIDFNGSVGIETNWENWIDDIFPLWWSFEVGAGFATADFYTPSLVRINGGVHYRF